MPTDTYTGPRLFGAPVGDFSLAQTLLFIFAITVSSLMLGTFVGICVLGLDSAIRHYMVDFSLSYKWFGFPLCVLMFVASTSYLGSLLIRRWTRKG